MIGVVCLEREGFIFGLLYENEIWHFMNDIKLVSVLSTFYYILTNFEDRYKNIGIFA